MTIAAVIVAAGSSSRMGGRKKEYRPLGAESARDTAGCPMTVLGAAVSAFISIEHIDIILIVVPSGGQAEARAAIPAEFLERAETEVAVPRWLFVEGGSSRRRSVHNALKSLANYRPDYVLIHDGARPWVDHALIQRCIDAVLIKNAVIPVLPLTETPKEIDSDGLIVRHPRRAGLVTAQTPQCFAFPAILEAHAAAAAGEERDGREYTDDAEVWAEFVGPVATVAGSPANRKITFPEDLP